MKTCAHGIGSIDTSSMFEYPMPANVAGKNDCVVGRIREDESASNSLWLWIVGDQLRKGAALNAVQIAEILIKK